MKRTILFISVVFCMTNVVMSQTPNSFKYQAVARTSAGEIMANEAVEFTISILQDSIDGRTGYSEIHEVITNQYGLVTFNIGEGINPSSDFSEINWSSGNYFVEIELNGKLMGTSQLLSVPFAKYADKSGLAQNLVLEATNGSKYRILVDSLGNLITEEIEFTCGDTLIDERDNKKYKTVLIGNQCWMSQNLNTGTLIDHSIEQSNNGLIEKYCYDYDLGNCDQYGGLYQWNELMQYHPSDTMELGTNQGVCPSGWHVATHKEWKTVFNTVGGEIELLKSSDYLNIVFHEFEQGDIGRTITIATATNDESFQDYCEVIVFYDYSSEFFFNAASPHNIGTLLRCIRDE